MEESRTEDLLQILIQLMGRTTFPTDELRQLIAPTGASKKQLAAYNLCDGSRTQAQVAKEAGLDQGNFSRTVTRWQTLGILFRLGSGRDSSLLHLYPLPSE